MLSGSQLSEGVVVDYSLLSVAPIMGFCVCSMFRCALLCMLFFCNHLDGEDRACCFTFCLPGVL